MKQRNKSITTLLFDWDGTIVDSAQLGLLAFKQSFAAMDLHFDQKVYETTYSPNWYSMYAPRNILVMWATLQKIF